MADELKSVRQTFLADEGEVLVRCDMSQIEHRMCLMYTRSARLVEIANRHPSVYDGHVDNARLIFGKQEIDKQERYLGKTTTHAAERDMRGKTLSEHILKDTEGKLFLDPKRCDRMLEAFHAGLFEIRNVYFPWAREQVISVRQCVNSWGRRWRCDKRRIDDDLFRQAYSFYMQSECADWVNQYLFRPMFYYMMAKYGKPTSLQVHDEVVVSVPLMDAWEVAGVMMGLAEQSREIPAGSGNWLKCPAEVKVGDNWGNGIEFKVLPGRDEFYAKWEEYHAND